jgi:putative oxidoreductase
MARPPIRPHGAAGRQLAGVRWAAAAVFIVFGAGKFVNHASELASFRQYDLPAPATFVYVIGVVEIAGGLLLAIGLLVRPAALVLAGDMVGAIVVSGIGRSEAISLTLAPVLLVAMCYLVWAGAGSWSLEARRVSHMRRGSGPSAP